MKRLLISLALAVASLVGLGAISTAGASSSAWWCVNPTYHAIYAYPTGSYWRAQIAAYPDYYAANNSFYQSAYGC